MENKIRKKFEKCWKRQDGHKVANVKIYNEEFKEEFRDFFGFGYEQGKKEQKAIDLYVVEGCLSYIPMKGKKRDIKIHSKGYEHGINTAIEVIRMGRPEYVG
jgi:tRNA A-37 threonylcarbamoyl transferase component Bud32